MMFRCLAACLFFVASCNDVAALSSSSPELLNKMQTAGAAATLAAAIAIAPLDAKASVFDGSYSDPNHPNCLREITSKGAEAQLFGTDGNPGCPADGSGTKWQLTGKISGKDIFVDFSPKGGPKDLLGVYDGTGIKWPDGNKWAKK